MERKWQRIWISWLFAKFIHSLSFTRKRSQSVCDPCALSTLSFAVFIHMSVSEKWARNHQNRRRKSQRWFGWSRTMPVRRLRGWWLRIMDCQIEVDNKEFTNLKIKKCFITQVLFSLFVWQSMFTRTVKYKPKSLLTHRDATVSSRSAVQSTSAPNRRGARHRNKKRHLLIPKWALSSIIGMWRSRSVQFKRRWNDARARVNMSYCDGQRFYCIQ